MIEDDEFVVHGLEPLEPLPRQTLGQLMLQNLLSNNVNNDFLVDAFTGKRLSYKQLLQDSCNLAGALLTCGYSVGTVLSICSENNIHYFTPVLASVFIGTVMAPINNNYTEIEIKHCISITRPKIIFCSLKTLPLFLKLQKQFNIDKIVIIDSDQKVPTAENLKNFVTSRLRGRSISPDKFQPFTGEAEKHALFILCSSGTTGLPKGVTLSHYNFVARVIQSRDKRFSIASGDYVLGLLPFFHGYGLNVGFNSMLNQNTVIVLNKFDEDIFLKSIEKYKISVLPIVPPLALFLIKSPKVLKYDLSSINEILCGAAPLSKDNEMALIEKLKLKSFRQGYGLTEVTVVVTIMPSSEKKSGSCGKVISYMSCKVRDPNTGRSLGPNQVGEICIKGPMVMMGYYNDEKATRECFTSDGWFKSGDLGYYDEEQYFFIVDRFKELIKYKGYQVAPAELEAVLLYHPKVDDVGVVGLPDELSGELPLAFVVKKKGVHITEQELQEYVAGRVSPQKRLRGGIIFVPSIPKNSTGKIIRRELKNMFKNYRSVQESKL